MYHNLQLVQVRSCLHLIRSETLFSKVSVTCFIERNLFICGEMSKSKVKIPHKLTPTPKFGYVCFITLNTPTMSTWEGYSFVHSFLSLDLVLSIYIVIGLSQLYVIHDSSTDWVECLRLKIFLRRFSNLVGSFSWFTSSWAYKNFTHILVISLLLIVMF